MSTVVFDIIQDRQCLSLLLLQAGSEGPTLISCAISWRTYKLKERITQSSASSFFSFQKLLGDYAQGIGRVVEIEHVDFTGRVY
jgi:hypothetical protein